LPGWFSTGARLEHPQLAVADQPERCLRVSQRGQDFRQPVGRRQPGDLADVGAAPHRSPELAGQADPRDAPARGNVVTVAAERPAPGAAETGPSPGAEQPLKDPRPKIQDPRSNSRRMRVSLDLEIWFLDLTPKESPCTA